MVPTVSECLHDRQLVGHATNADTYTQKRIGGENDNKFAASN